MLSDQGCSCTPVLSLDLNTPLSCFRVSAGEIYDTNRAFYIRSVISHAKLTELFVANCVLLFLIIVCVCVCVCIVLQKSDSDVKAMKKQAENLTLEYDRLLDEHVKLQVRPTNISRLSLLSRLSRKIQWLQKVFRALHFLLFGVPQQGCEYFCK